MPPSTPLASFLESIPLFDGLSAAERARILSRFEAFDAAPGVALCQEGAPGPGLFILEEGHVKVHKSNHEGNEEVLATLGPGAVIGEVAVFDALPASATATTMTSCRVHVLDVASVVQLRLSFEPALYKVFRNLTVTLSRRLREMNQRVRDWMDEPEKMLQDVQARRRSAASGRTLSIDAELMRRAVESLEAERSAPRRELPAGDRGPDLMVAPIYDPGTGHPDPARILDFLRQLPIFQSLLDSDLEALSETLLEELRPTGAVIFREGDRGGDFYLLASGLVEVQRQAVHGGMETLVRLRPGAMFGEMALIDGGPRSATCVVVADATLLALSRRDFEALFNANSALAFRFIEILGMDLSRCLRAVDDQFTTLCTDVELLSPEFLAQLRQLRDVLEMKSFSTGMILRSLVGRAIDRVN